MSLIEELIEILQTFRIQMPLGMIEAWRMMIMNNSLIVYPTNKLDIVKEDPDDNKLFEAAIVGKAEYIISQDKKHVLSIGEYKGIQTISPEQFLQLFR